MAHDAQGNVTLNGLRVGRFETPNLITLRQAVKKINNPACVSGGAITLQGIVGDSRKLHRL